MNPENFVANMSALDIWAWAGQDAWPWIIFGVALNGLFQWKRVQEGGTYSLAESVCTGVVVGLIGQTVALLEVTRQITLLP